MTNTPSKSIRRLQALALSLKFAADDMSRTQTSGQPLVYNFDFGLLRPQLFPTTHTRSTLHKETVPRVRRILDVAPSSHNVRITISGPTLLEFQDQLGHLVHAIEYSVRDSVSRLARGGDSFLREALTTSGEIRDQLVHDLDLVTEAGRNNLKTPVTRLMELIEHGALAGVEDVVDLSSYRATGRQRFEKLLKQHRATRLQTDLARRSPQESEFHYKMDAANVLLTQASARSSDVPILFVTQTHLNIRQCVVGDRAYGRSDLVPLAVVNVEQMIAEGSLGAGRSAVRHLRMLGIEGVELADELKDVGSLEALPEAGLMDHARYLDKAQALTADHAPQRRRAAAENAAKFEEMRELIKDSRKLANAIDEGVATVRAAAKVIDAMYERSSAAYVDDWSFEDDPIFQRMRRDLGLGE